LPTPLRAESAVTRPGNVEVDALRMCELAEVHVQVADRQERAHQRFSEIGLLHGLVGMIASGA